ncbi:MAG: class I SAM-dependent methyltransferase, partial [Candidatus Dormibacteraceae bacterium]
MDTTSAESWVTRWEAQQDRFMPDREERFALMFELLRLLVGEGPMTVLDLGCGPGSLAIRLLDRFPQARVIGVDLDPVLLQIGRQVHGDEPRLRFVTADLSQPGWERTLPLDEAPAAALSTTALHWLELDDLTRLYADLARLLRPGGAFLDGDHAHLPGQPRLVEAAAKLAELLRDRRTRPLGEGETWEGWWEAVRDDPALAGAIARRDRLGHGHHRGTPIDDAE